MDFTIVLSNFILLSMVYIVPISTQTCSNKFDLVFIVDSSGSIRDNNPEDQRFDNWQLVKQFLKTIVETFNIGEVRTFFFSKDQKTKNRVEHIMIFKLK